MPKVVPEYKDEAKKRIISAALEVMGEKGYAKTTMDDIADRLGVSKGAIYQYFRTRDELLAAFVSKMHEENMKTVMKVFPSLPPLDAWTALFDRYLSLDSAYSGLFFEIIATSSRNEAVREMFGSEILGGIGLASQGVARQEKKGLIHPDVDPKTIAVALMSLFIGMRSLVLLGADMDEIREQWRAIGSVLLGVGEGNGNTRSG